MDRIIVIGAGAAGLLAGIAAAEQGVEVVLLEKMPSPGRKMLITGKGRCNITNVCDTKEMIRNIPGNGKFLYSALNKFSNKDIVYLLETNGVPTKTERGGRIFPVSDRAQEVVDALSRVFRKANGRLISNSRVASVKKNAAGDFLIKTTEGNSFSAGKVILATGGSSYPGTGSTGDGYRLAAALGHSISPLLPALVPMLSDSPYIKALLGLSLRNVEVTLSGNDKLLGREFGEMLFTHVGLSGPIILTLGKAAARELAAGTEVILSIDLKPALSEEVLDQRLQRDFTKYAKKQLINAMVDLLPQRLIEVVLDAAYLNGTAPVNQLTREERHRLLLTLKGLTFAVTGTGSLAEAIVTAGGVAVKEVDPRTMESKIVPGLYLAGEVLDIDGYTGGYNLQAAYSTGYVAGSSAAEGLLNDGGVALQE